MERPQIAQIGPGLAALPPRQEAAAFALARGRSLHDAAKESGAGERTIKTWTATLPAFTQRIAELRSQMTGQTLGRMADNMASAADTMGFLCRKAKSESVRLAAARAIVELGMKLRETVELEERIAALEGQTPQRRLA